MVGAGVTGEGALLGTLELVGAGVSGGRVLLDSTSELVGEGSSGGVWKLHLNPCEWETHWRHFMDKEDNSSDDIINKWLLDRTIDGISDSSKDGLLDRIIDGISGGSKYRILDWCFDSTIKVFQTVLKIDF